MASYEGNVQQPHMEEADFVVLSEDYSRFLAHDGTMLRAKIVVRKIFLSAERSPEGYPVGFGIDPLNVINALVPQSNKRQPSPEPFDPRRDKGEEIKFEEQDVKTQEYMTSNGFRITVRPVLTKVFKYKKYNNYGEPIYNVGMQAITNIDKIASTATL